MQTIQRMEQQIEAAQHPLSQVPITFKRFRRDNALEGDSYERIMAQRLTPVKFEIPEGYVHVTMKLAAMSFLLNPDFRMDLFQHSVTAIQGRSIKSEGYFQILGENITEKRQVNWTFRPVDRYTFYNELEPHERSFHACGGVGSLYIDASPDRGLIVCTTPFHPDDISIALAKREDLEAAIKREPISKTRAFINTIKSAARRYV